MIAPNHNVSTATRRGLRLLLALLIAGLGMAGATPADRTPAPDGSGEAATPPWTGEPGLVETVAEIMAREGRAAAPDDESPGTWVPSGPELRPKVDNPMAPAVSQWPPEPSPDPWSAAPGMESALPESGALADPLPENPQTAGTNFEAIVLSESNVAPPATAGDVGPTQVLVAANGRIKVFAKDGTVGGLNTTLNGFFNSVRAFIPTTDPQVRYDRLSGRWFVTCLTGNTPNRVLIAVSSGSTITAQSSFTFYWFRHDLVSPAGDTSLHANDPSLGIDRFALYLGFNIYSTTNGTFIGSSGHVVNKAALLAGTLSVTAFRNLIAGADLEGPFAPRGVDNDNPAATEGYFVGVDYFAFSRLVIRRISDPGGTPAISGNIYLVVPTTNYPIAVPHLGMNAGWTLSALDDRLFAARLGVNKITGVSSLWTAHNIVVNASGISQASGGRNGARWYQVGNLTTTPNLIQSGTLFDPAATNPRSYWIPSVAMSGQGHMALGSSTAGALVRVDVATAGRLAGGTLGTTQAATLQTASTTAYNFSSTPLPQTWGDVSYVGVDPTDNMTMWTFQEYCDATNSWGIRAVQLLAPPPATPSAAAPTPVCADLASVDVTITGTSTAGSAFFDPGADAGGPGFPNHIGAAVTGGVVVNGVTFNTATQVRLTLSTVAASAGAADVTITNPDGQSRIGTGLLTILPTFPTTASNNGPICAGATLQLNAATVPGATYSWSGPNGFTSTQQNPAIPNATAADSGTYAVTTTVNGCLSPPSMTAVTVIGDGEACSDGSACSLADSCQDGVCVGANPVICAALDQCHDVGTCDPGTGLCSDPAKADGSRCSDGDGDACTLADACQGGTCISGAPVVCAPLDECHDAGVCDPGNGLCSDPVKADGSACSDGDACTLSDSCQAGACVGTNPVVCAPLDQCHDAGVCDPGSGLCSDPAKTDGTACDDGSACTQPDSCQAGVCVGANPVLCAALDQCHDVGACDPGTGLCSDPAKVDGSACSDGDGCTLADACQAGACIPGAPLICTALDQCHDAGVCDPGTGLCSDPARTDGTTCDDGSACTQPDSCQAGVCVGANPVLCAALDQCHDVGTCDPGTGLCSDPAKADGSACSDGDGCTLADACQAGACVPGAPLTCTALDQCHDAGVCDPGTGLCSDPARTDGTTCDDGSACTQPDSCQAGVCVGANPVLCAALDQCHDVGTCDPGTGLCSDPAKADGSSCSDGDACTLSDSCQAGACVGTNPVVCTALDQCHDAGVCDPGTGLCSDPVKADGSACSDSDACTLSDSCQAGACVGTNPIVCTALDQCHDAGVCDPGSGLCSDPARTDGTACDDGSACTQPDSCQAGVCVGANPVLCAASDQCHDVGTCDPGTGLCSDPAKADGSACSDGSACTQPDSCQAGVCVGGPPPDLDGDGRVDGLCGGDDCNDTNPLVWAAPGEVTNLLVATESPADLAWDSQSLQSGPETGYDLVSGVIVDAGTLDFAAALCLQSNGPAGYSDTRSAPPLGSVYWYLVRGRNSCGTGTYGSPPRDSTIAPCP